MIPAGRLVSAVDLTRDTFYLRSSGDYSSLFVVRAVRVSSDDGFTGIVSKFTFGDGGGDSIAGLAAYDSGLSLVIKRPEGLALEWLKLVAEPGDSFVDRKGYAEGETPVVGRYRFTRPFVNDQFGRPIVGRRVQIFGLNFDVVNTKSFKVVTLEVAEPNTTSAVTLKGGLMTGRASVGVRGDAEKTSVELLLDGVEWVVVLEAGAGRRHR